MATKKKLLCVTVLTSRTSDCIKFTPDLTVKHFDSVENATKFVTGSIRAKLNASVDLRELQLLPKDAGNRPIVRRTKQGMKSALRETADWTVDDFDVIVLNYVEPDMKVYAYTVYRVDEVKVSKS